MIDLLIASKAIWIPILTTLIAWLLPSPLKSATDEQARIAQAEKKADSTKDVTDLDEVP